MRNDINSKLKQQLSTYGDLVEIDILQPADIFVDLIGETIRSRTLSTLDQMGREWTLRPEFTLPLCAHYMKEAGGQPRSYTYFGKVFRCRFEAPVEFMQAGIEYIGHQDRLEQDAQCLSFAYQMAESLNSNECIINIGDKALFIELVTVLQLPEVIEQKLIRHFGDQSALRAIFEKISDEDPLSPEQNEIALLSSEDLANYVEQKFNKFAFHKGTGRQPEEIVQRFYQQIQLRTSQRIDPKKLAIIEGYLNLQAPLDQASKTIKIFLDSHNISISSALQTFEDRVKAFASAGLEMEQLVFNASLGRSLAYYTGFVFEGWAKIQKTDGPLFAGGRYDKLIEHFGTEPTPAIGCALWLDRFEGAAIDTATEGDIK